MKLPAQKEVADSSSAFVQSLFEQKRASRNVRFRTGRKDAGLSWSGAARYERGRECTYEYMTNRANNATKPGRERTSRAREFWVIWSSD